MCTAKVVVVGGGVGEEAHALLLARVEAVRCEESAHKGDDSRAIARRIQDQYGLAL